MRLLQKGRERYNKKPFFLKKKVSTHKKLMVCDQDFKNQSICDR